MTAAERAEVGAGARAAATRGVAWLAQAQLVHGELAVRRSSPSDPEWRAEPALFGTTLLASALVAVPGTEAIRARACDHIESQREVGGVWRRRPRLRRRHNDDPPDLDSTCAAALALAANGRRAPRNRRLILANRAPGGLFHSWIAARGRFVASPADWFASARQLLLGAGESREGSDAANWRRDDVDAVANANVLAWLGRERATERVADWLIEILCSCQEPCCDRHYENAFAVRYFFSRALRRAGAKAGGLLLGRIAVEPTRSPLDVALALCVRMDWQDLPAEAEVMALLESQLATGAWPLAPFAKDGETRWGSEEVTTGLCLEALSRWLAAADQG